MQRYRGGIEIVVVAPSAERDVAEAVAATPGARLVASDAPLLAGEARNLGVRESQGPLIAFIDAYCVPDPGWLSAAVAALEAGAMLVAGGPVLNALPWHPVAPVDNLLQFAEQGPWRPNGRAAYLPGCNLAMRREIFDELGGFLEGVAVIEDVELSLSAVGRDPRALCFVQQMTVRHRGRTRPDDFWRHQETFGYVRGRSGRFLTRKLQRLGARSALAPLVVLKRLAYITARTAQWNPLGLVRIVLLLPVVLLGLAAWARGFQRGCREAMAG
jgi:GT2 family glycosyltransferase